MKKLIWLFLLMVSGWSATTPITGIEVNPSGWNVHITISIISSGGTFRIDHGPNHTHTSSTPYLYVKRFGFNDIGQHVFVYDTVYIDTIIDKRTPNTGTDSTYADGSNIVVCAALSDFITDYDTVKSIVIPKGFYVNGSDSSAAYTATSLTNNSTAKYPVSWGKLLETDRQRHQSSTFTLRAKAGSYYGRNGRPVRAVMFRVEDQHGNVDSVFVTTTTKIMNRFSPPLYPKTDSICDEFYIGTIDNTKFTQGDSLLCDIYVYPWVGNDESVLKTNDGVYGPHSPNYHTLVHMCDKTGEYGSAVACVDTLNGDDGTATVTNMATFDKNAPPNKFKNLHAAVNAIAAYNNTTYGHNDVGGGTIYCYTDQVWTGGTVTATTMPKTYLTIRPAPDTSYHQLKFKRQSGTKHTGPCTRIVGMAFDTAIAAGYMSSTDYFVWLDSCKIDVPEYYLMYYATTYYLTNCAVYRLNNGFKPFGIAAASAQWPILSGNYIYGMSGQVLYHTFTGNIVDSCAISFYDTLGLYPDRLKGTFFENNKLIRLIQNSYIIYLYKTLSDSSGRSITGNLFENILYTASPQCMVWVAADGSIGNISNVVMSGNTFTGWRNNSFYNDAGTEPRYLTFIRRINNIYEDDNIKSDNFGTMNANRIGNWSVLYGVGSSGNINAESEVGADGFLYRFPGISSIQRPYNDDIGNDSMYMKFVDRKAWNGLTTVSNVGGGDYHLQYNSPAVGLKKTLYYSYDITGKHQYIGESSAAGAYEYGEPTVISCDSNLYSIDTSHVGATQLIIYVTLVCDNGDVILQITQDTNSIITNVDTFININSTYIIIDTIADLTPSNDYFFRATFVSDTGSTPATDTTNWFMITMKDTGDTSDPWYLPPEFTITTNVVGSGTLIQDPDTSIVDSGTVIHFTATPNTGWSFSGYSGDLTSTDSIDSIVLSSNINITATFTSTFTIDSLRAVYNYRGWTFSIWCDNANALTSTDSIFLGDTFINTVGNLRIHDGLINVPIPEDMPSNWYKVSINDIEFVDDSIRVFVPKWGN